MKYVNSKLEKRVINLQKNQAKTEQYSRRNNIELSGIANGVLEINLEIAVEDICNDFGLEIETKDIERSLSSFTNLQILFLVLFVLTTGISGLSAKTKMRENLSSLGGIIAAKVTEPTKARKLFHEYGIIDIYTDDV